MSAVGTNTTSSLSREQAPTTHGQNVTVGAADIVLGTVFNSAKCRVIYCNGAGNLYVQRRNDVAPALYVVTAGTVIEGEIVLIGGSTNHAGASAIQLVLEA